MRSKMEVSIRILWLQLAISIRILLFRCVLASLYEALYVRRSVGRSRVCKNDLKVVFLEGNDLKVIFSERNDLKVIFSEGNDLRSYNVNVNVSC